MFLRLLSKIDKKQLKLISKMKSFFRCYAIYTVVFLLLIASFVPVRSHMICGGCPWDANSQGNTGSNGWNSQCEYCNTNHNNHVYEPPEEEDDEPARTAACQAARDACEEHLQWTAATCTGALFLPGKLKVACALAAARAVQLKARVIMECGWLDSGV